MWHLRYQELVGPRIILRESPVMLNDKLHGVTPQKISSIYINAVRTPNPAMLTYRHYLIRSMHVYDLFPYWPFPTKRKTKHFVALQWKIKQREER